MMWGIWGWLLMIGWCLLLVAFIVNTIFLVIGTYKDTKAGRYGEGDWSIMCLTSIPILISCLAMYGLYYTLIYKPFWL